MARVLSYSEVQVLLPRLIEQTEKTIRLMGKGKKVIDNILLPENEQESIESDMVELFSLWVSWVRLHGGIVRAPWLVDFDNGQGYWCWQSCETEVQFEHSYDDNYQDRKTISSDRKDMLSNKKTDENSD